MYIDSEKYPIDKQPRFQCPKCSHGVLTEILDSRKYFLPPELLKIPENLTFYIDEEGNERPNLTLNDIKETEHWWEYVSLFYQCDQLDCRQIVLSSGKLIQEIVLVPCEVDQYNELPFYEELVVFYKPNYFYPTVSLFAFDSNIPESLKNEVKSAFSLFWHNPEACSNSIRKSLELILDNIAPIVNGNRYDRINSLGNRINNLGGTYSDVKDLLKAVKWIGNDGSHEGGLLHSDVMNGFEMLELCLGKIYNKKEVELKEIAEKINEAKKPLSKL